MRFGTDSLFAAESCPLPVTTAACLHTKVKVLGWVTSIQENPTCKEGGGIGWPARLLPGSQEGHFETVLIVHHTQ